MAEYNPDLQVVHAFVEALYEAGVSQVVIAPGSRSTPLAIAFVRHAQFKVWTVLDERSAGFFAYGMARVKHVPVALLCTSGTATANLFPAVVEAFQSQVPLLVITADRPPELHGVGSNQTVDQDGLYGTFVKRFIAMPVPGDEPLLFRHARWTATRAAALTMSEPSGPVHINWPFREPLLPQVADRSSGGITPHLVRSGRLQLPEAELALLANTLSGAGRGLIICGPQDSEELAVPLLELASELKFPVLADPLSQLRTSGIASPWLIDHYDAFLRSVMANAPDHPLRVALEPETVIRIGQTPTSKVLGQYLSSLTTVKQVVIDGSGAWQDPFFTATEVWQADALPLIRGLLQRQLCAGDEGFARRWQRVAMMVREVILHEVPQLKEVFEGRVWLELARVIPAGAVIFAGNSMPVRDMDSFFAAIDRPVRVFANRGASGIDGVVSSALGVSAAGRSPVYLVIGDLSFFHDLNALLIAKMHSLSLNVILIHNDGGGIFSFLPQSTQADVFSYFSTSHGLEFAAMIEGYGGSYERIDDWQQLQRALVNADSQSGLRVMELRTNRDENVRLHQRVFQSCANAVSGLGAEWFAGN